MGRYQTALLPQHCNLVDLKVRERSMDQNNRADRNWGLLIQNLVDGFLVLSESNQILFANQAFSDYFESAPKEIIGKSLVDLLNAKDENASKDWQVILQRALSEPNSPEHFLNLKTPEISRLFSISTTLYQPSSGQSYLVSIWREVRERYSDSPSQPTQSKADSYQNALTKIAAGLRETGELTDYQAQLEELVRMRTEELREQYKEMEVEIAVRKKAEQAEREQRTMAEALEKTAAILTSTLDLDQVLDSILVTLENVIPHDSANIMLVDENTYSATVARYKKNPKINSAQKPPVDEFPIFETPTLFTMYHTKQPYVISDVSEDSSWIEQIGSDWIRSYIAAPILFGEEVLGFLNLVSDTVNFYSQPDGERLLAFANHASIAIRNARLFDQAGEVATLQERQRLATDIHDAVSQTLISADVVAENLPRIMEHDPEQGKAGVIKIRKLIQSALAKILEFTRTSP